MKDATYFNEVSRDLFPGLVGIQITHISAQEVRAELAVTPSHLAHNGYLHAGSIVSLADTACGNGCAANLPEHASGFTTMELKSNHLATVGEGIIECIATPVHVGRTTQVWDATVSAKETGKKLAVFRCSQLILYRQSTS